MLPATGQPSPCEFADALQSPVAVADAPVGQAIAVGRGLPDQRRAAVAARGDPKTRDEVGNLTFDLAPAAIVSQRLQIGELDIRQQRRVVAAQRVRLAVDLQHLVPDQRPLADEPVYLQGCRTATRERQTLLMQIAHDADSTVAPAEQVERVAHRSDALRYQAPRCAVALTPGRVFAVDEDAAPGAGLPVRAFTKNRGPDPFGLGV
jgi:hypothetical protein